MTTKIHNPLTQPDESAANQNGRRTGDDNRNSQA